MIKTKLDILYIHPPQHIQNNKFLIFPVGVSALINILKQKGLKCGGINYPLEKSLNKNFSLKKILHYAKPKIVLIDFHWYVHFKGMVAIAKICKKTNPEIKIIVGGYSATIFGEEILKYRILESGVRIQKPEIWSLDTEESSNRPLHLLKVGAIYELPLKNKNPQPPKFQIPLVDYVVRGESELPLVELVHCILNKVGAIYELPKQISAIPNISYYKNGKVVHNSFTYTANNLDKLNFTDLSFMQNFKKHFFLHLSSSKINEGDIPTYYLVIGRGCPCNCYFCFGSQNSQKKYFNRNHFGKIKIKSLVSDIKKLKSYGVERFHPNLDLQLLGKKNYLKFFKILKEKKLKIALINDCFIIPEDIFIKEFVDTVNIKNSKILLTLFCGNEKIRKKCGRNIDTKNLFKFLSLLKKYSLTLEIFFQPNLPGESFKNFKETINLAERINRFYPAELLSMQMFPVLLDPYSPRMIKKGFKKNLKPLNLLKLTQLSTQNKWHLFNYGYKNLSRNEIKKEQKLWSNFEKKIFWQKFFKGIILRKRLNYYQKYFVNKIKKM